MTGYYVTIKRDNRTGWLYGPLADHDECKAMVPQVREAAIAADPFACFDAFGTGSITSDKPLPSGILNAATWSL